MHFHIITSIIIIMEHINRIFTQTIPISPCPKIFQYRFDGDEWSGILSVRNPNLANALHIKVTLSVQGWSTTNYQPKIQLLTRGQYFSDAPVLYKIYFGKAHFPPKLQQVMVNNRVICFGQPAQGVLVTKIVLEHTRKFIFSSDKEWMAMPEHAHFPTALGEYEEDTDNNNFMPADTGFDMKNIPNDNAKHKPNYSTTQSICGKIDKRIRSQTLQSDNISQQDDDNDYATAININEEFSAARREGSSDQPVIIPTIAAEPAGGNTKVDSHFSGVDQAILTAAPTNLPPTAVISRGMWPWLAAIYVNNFTSLAYQCAGTLVSAHVVISSAHCFHILNQRYRPNEVLVFLGRHNLKNLNEEDSWAAPVGDIFIHPDFDAQLGTYDADIAVVVLQQKVHFNSYIRPACLWSGASQLEYVVGERGSIVGWDLSHINGSAGGRHAIAAIPRFMNVPIVSNEACFAADPHLQSLSSKRTFCANIPTTAHNADGHFTFGSNRKQLSLRPCTGDSGGGLLLRRSNRWLLRGIVSATTAPKTKNCLSNQYVILTDVAKFLDWILAFTI